MTSADILTKPWKVNQRMECLYAYAPGEVCIDLTSGKPEDRARVLALVGQAQAAFSLLVELAEGGSCESSVTCAMARSGQFDGMKECPLCRARAVLRDAKVLSGDDVQSEGT